MNQSFENLLESLSVFLSLAKLGEEERVVWVDQLVKVSRQCRGIMKDCQSSWSSWLRLDLPLSHGIISQSDLLYQLELIWHLVDIVYLDTTTGGLVLPYLLHFPGCEERVCTQPGQ